MYFIKSLELFNFHDKFKINFRNDKLNKDKQLIVHKGQYLLNFFLELSKLNESDRFAILLDDRIIFTKRLNVRKEYRVEISINLDVLNETSTLNFLNNSDDLLIANTIKGGLYMSDFSITSIDNANNKSFDLTLSEAFTDDFTAEIKSLATNTEYICSLVSNSLFPDDPLKKTLIIGKIDYYSATGHSTAEQALIDLIVPSHQTYEITVFKNDPLNTSASKSVILDSFDAISDPTEDVKINVTGDRIFETSFNYPLKNVFDVVGIDANGEITTDPALIIGHVLCNFYSLYYGRDTNNAVDPTKIKWTGAFNIDRPQFSAALSSDGKTLVLQDNDIGMPLTDGLDPHKLSLNQGKYHSSYNDKNKVLTDYSEEKRIIPKMEIPFVVAAEAVTAIPTDAVAPVRNEVTVNFDKAVMKPLDSSVSTAKILFKTDGTPLDLIKITRPENSFKTLIFELDPSSALPSGLITLGVGSITEGVGDLVDACGYVVPRTNLSFIVGSIPPTLISAVQDKDPSYTDNTVINLTFSTSMNPSTTGTGALNIANYTFVDSNTNPQEIQSAVFVDTDNKVVRLTFKNLLGAGDYRLIISSGAITDTINEPIGYTNSPVAIEDTTKPSVLQIIGLRRPASETSETITDEDNALIIKYKTPMLVSTVGADNRYAADQPSNYKFVESLANPTPPPPSIITPPTDGPLPDGTTATPLKSDKWIRFVLPTDLNPNYPIFEDKTVFNGNPNTNYNIYIGYTDLDDIKNVRNTSGNIYPLCDLKKIDATVPLINLSVGNVEITSDSELKYTYTDKTTILGNDYNNEFYTLAPEDFVIKVSSSVIPDPSPIIPLDIKSLSLSDDGTTITFKFASGTFTSADKYAYIDGNENVLDIFGKGLTDDVFNNMVINSVPSTLVGVSLTKISRTATKITMDGSDLTIGYPIEIALKFSNIIKNTACCDFLVTFNNAINSPITSANILQVNSANSDTILLESYIPSVATDDLDNILLIRTVSDKTLITTKDINNNAITPFGYIPVINLAVSNADCKFETPADLNGATLEATFNKDLDFDNPPLLAVKNAGAIGLPINDTNFVTTDTTDNILTPYVDLIDTAGNKLGKITLKKVDANNSIFVNSKEGKVNEALILSTDAVNLANEAKTAADATLNATTITAATAAVTSAGNTKTAAETAKDDMTAVNVAALASVANTSATDANDLVTAATTYNTNINTAQTDAITAQTSAQAAVDAANVEPYDGPAVLTATTDAQTAAVTAQTSATTAANPPTKTAADAAVAAATVAVAAATTANTTPTADNIAAAKAAIADLKTATDATVTAATAAIEPAATAVTAATDYKTAADATKTAADAAVAASSDSDIKFNVNIKKGTENSELSFTFSKITADLTLNMDNLAYIEYTGEAYQFMDSNDELYTNISLDYNANTALK